MKLDAAVVLRDHAVDRGQAESRALAHFLGGKEWVEDLAQSFLVHAVARISNTQHDRASPLDRVRRLDARGRRDVPGLESHPPSSGHRVRRVHAEIHEHALNLRRVRENLAQRRLESQLDLDVLPEHAADHLLEAAQLLVETQQARLENLLTTESQ